MDEKKICTAENKRKKATEFGEWIYFQKMKAFHERFRNEYDDHREYFSNMALHESYEEEHVAEKLHTQCNGHDCLIDKRRLEMHQEK